MSLENERRVISVIVMNESSVLARVTSLFAARGYNISSLTVAPIPNSDMSHITIETQGSPRVMEQITKQLHKLIPVYKVIEHEEMVEKEMVLVKFPIAENLSDIAALCSAYNGGIVNVGTEMVIAMVADEPCRIRHFIEATERYNPIEVVRGGVVAIER
ncbi:acetolactate synthase small subunit [Sulfurovum sp.]|jgi:acetolactate synthase-1/3 small subunit|uniref:acetolactate synthase small subunit n=1 Tax=Sulfurovum sp. TaxID=1969726 RepID=UPI002A365DA8|nr:acetolactate synthase small subunit [Sulfurovum sp.]MDD2451391.1 acetolactate synthase small subunit [Sulfurovum sp.]MDD3499263.1 acetolactate synthase small subunit [Sulfurovum sp.]MDY0402476.1 acetolactate synthase small subunit [Sulfurovum sp.]